MTRTEETQVLLDTLEAKVAEVSSGEDWRHLLDVQGKLYRYSFGNQILIMEQDSDATMVAGYRAWQGMGRQVRKGERSIRILAPCTYKVKNDDGTEGYRVGGFRTVGVFDVASTDGPELPPALRPLEGDAPEGAWQAVAARVTAEGYRVELGDTSPAEGFTRPADKLVKVTDKGSDAHKLSVLCHELGHILLGHVAEGYDYRACRGIAEVEAESVAYVVGSALGLATTDPFAFGYVTGWSKGDAKMVRKVAERVLKVSRSILEAVDTGEPLTESRKGEAA